MSPRAGLDRQAVVTAAARMVDEEGYSQVTLGAVAGKLGVRTPSLYNHVSGLPELQLLLALRGLEQLGQSVSAAAVGRKGNEALLELRGGFGIDLRPDDSLRFMLNAFLEGLSNREIGNKDA
jgi:AcrR family transcriptional regulator